MSHEEEKRASRITSAKLAIALGSRYVGRYPSSTATPVVKDMRLALSDLIDEIGLLQNPPATGVKT